MDDQEPALMDVAQIDGLVAAAGADGAREILEAFWQSTRTLLASLEKELSEKAFGEAAKTAHAVKGSAANVGAKRLAVTISSIEKACRDGNAQLADEALPTAKKDFSDFQECFSAHIAKC